MKALLFPLAIAMVITFAFGYFKGELGYSDVALITLATIITMEANIFRLIEQKQHQGLQTMQDVIKDIC